MRESGRSVASRGNEDVRLEADRHRAKPAPRCGDANLVQSAGERTEPVGGSRLSPTRPWRGERVRNVARGDELAVGADGLRARALGADIDTNHELVAH